MGELFRQIRPEAPLPWTGERMVTGLTGAIEAEHYHRYFLARELCRGKDVLDVASGEGYGSAFLAQTARSVVGVELDPDSVEHAAREYRSANLSYAVGEATKLPLDDHSVDAVVSFETVEHLSDHAAFLAEVKRVLRAGGFLIISTPDMNVYSASGTDANPYHVRELTESEFRETLGRAFRKVSLVRQRAITGSAILSDCVDPQPDNTWIFEQRDSRSFEADHKLLRAPFLIAVASDRDVPSLGVSLYIQTVDVTDIAAEVKAELERLRAVEQNAREQGPVIAKAMNDAAAVPALQAELDRLRQVEATAREQAPILAAALSNAAAIPALQAELERLRQVEAAAREQAAVVARLAADAASARAEAEGCKRAGDLREAEFERVRSEATAAREAHAVELSRAEDDAAAVRNELTLAREENTSLAEQRDRARDELSAAQSQSEAAMSLARQQSLTSQRSLLEVISVRHELMSVRQDLDRHKAEYQQAAGLLIPLRVRRALPGPLKTPLRAIKRALRSLARRTP